MQNTREDLCKSGAGWGGAVGPPVHTCSVQKCPWVLEGASGLLISLVVPNMTWMDSDPGCSYGAIEG